MKTSYLPDKKNSLSRKISFLLVAGVFVFFVFKERSLVYENLVYYSFEAARPVWIFRDHLSEKFFNFLVMFEENKDILRENDILRKELIKIDIRSSMEKILREENLVLKRMLGRKDLADEFAGDMIPQNNRNEILNVADRGVVSAAVSGQNIFPYNVLMLDAGHDLGILPGDLVVEEPGIVLGEVIETSKNISKVVLFSSYGKKTSVFIGQEKTMIAVTGAGSGNFRVILPMEFEVKKGDPVKYPGIGDLLIGIVSDVHFDVNSSYKEVLVSVPLNIRQTDLVRVIPGRN